MKSSVVADFRSDPVDGSKPRSESKNIVICFDGTGGEPGWGVQKDDGGGLFNSCVQEDKGKSYKESFGLSNCCKMHLLAGGNVGNTGHTEENQAPLYYSGVGTRGLFRKSKTILGLGAMEDIYSMAYEDLEKIHNDGDRLFVFGFSRGAATARLFCSFLNKNPIRGSTPKVALLGVFDTVCESFPIFGGVGVSDSPDILDSPDALGFDEKEHGKVPDNVAKVVHLVSIDDYRQPFTPTLFKQDPKVTEIWCPGVHSDIGGGYYNDGLSDLTLDFMLMVAKNEEMKVRNITEDICKKTLTVDMLCFDEEKFVSFDKDMKIEPDALDPDIHNTMSTLYKTITYAKNLVSKEQFTYRELRRLGSEDPILLLDATIERVQKWAPSDIPETFEVPSETYTDNKYRPKYLVGKPYKVVSIKNKNMSIPEEVFEISEEEFECITKTVDVW